MSEEAERVYTINLGKVLLSPNNIRAKRAINMIREFATRHMKIEDVRLDEEVSHRVWRRGIRHPPRKIRVRMEKADEGYVMVRLYDEEPAGTEDEAPPPAEETPKEQESETEDLESETEEPEPETEDLKPEEEPPGEPEEAKSTAEPDAGAEPERPAEGQPAGPKDAEKPA